MNQKAIRQDIEFPFLLNLSENRPFVSEDFRSAEHLNAPYLNNMFMPFWKKDVSYNGSQPVWDSSNNEYKIENGYLTKNGENLFAINNKHFKREDVTEDSQEENMNIQIFGKTKCFDTKKAERYFKERRIKYQYIDIIKYGMSRGELKSVCTSVGMDAIVNKEDQDYPLYQYLASADAKLEKLYEIPELIQTPIVRNGKKATVGYCPEMWKEWE